MLLEPEQLLEMMADTFHVYLLLGTVNEQSRKAPENRLGTEVCRQFVKSHVDMHRDRMQKMTPVEFQKACNDYVYAQGQVLQDAMKGING